MAKILRHGDLAGRFHSPRCNCISNWLVDRFERWLLRLRNQPRVARALDECPRHTESSPIPHKGKRVVTRRNRTGSGYIPNSLRRSVPATAIKPVPNNTSVPGSGTPKCSLPALRLPFPSWYH